MRLVPVIDTIAKCMSKLGLVQQLRWVFFLIVSVMGTAIVLAILQFQTLRDKQFNLLHSSVPVLVSAQSVERALSDLILNVRDIERAPDRLSLGPIRQAAGVSLDLARTNVAGLIRNPFYRDRSEKILQSLDEIAHSIERNFEIKSGLLETREKLTVLKGLLAKERELIRRELDEMSFHAAARVDQAIAAIVKSQDQSIGLLRKNLSAQTVEAASIAQLALEFETIFGVVDQLGETLSTAQIGKARDFLEFRMRGAILTIPKFSEIRHRISVARRTQSIQKIAFGTDGTLGQLEKLAVLAQDFQEQNAVGQKIVRFVSEATESLVVSANRDLNLSGSLTEVATKRLILILSVTAVTTIFIVVFAIYFILELRINQRLSHLTESVLHIASGDTDIVIGVDGEDELGRMAGAMEIFRRNARELIRSNSELKKFAYVAAHDLRSPLQGIRDLTEWTIEDDGNELSSDSVQNLDLMQARIGRLQTLLSDLLLYARIDPEVSELSEIDFEQMIDGLKSDLDPHGNFEILTVSEEPVFETYNTPLQRVFRILIDNSIKHHEGETGSIWISSRIENNRLTVEFKDDGPGVLPEYHEKIFELFQTLKSRDQVEGSGLGLAMSRKIVEHFDGKIAIISDPNKEYGATFTFDFPVRATVAAARAA